MRTRLSHILTLLLVFILVSCASTGTADRPPIDPKTEIQKAVIAVHQGLYLPAMEGLGKAHDLGNRKIIQLEPQIQAASEQYVKAKDTVDVLIKNWNILNGKEEARAQLTEMLAAIGRLQSFQIQSSQ